MALRLLAVRANPARSILNRSIPSTSFAIAPIMARSMSAGHGEPESFEAFSERYVSFFGNVQDVFELQRGLNNCFSHDLVPAPSVVEAALRAARRVNDFSTAVRIFEGIKEKVENRTQYDAYVTELKPLRDELGITLREELYSTS